MWTGAPAPAVPGSGGVRTGRVSAGTPIAGVSSAASPGSAGTWPSTLTLGSHSSQRGRYQFQSPSSSMAAGTMIVRTTVASMRTATARPKPICWNMTSSPLAMPPKTQTMMAAAPVMMPAVRPTP